MLLHGIHYLIGLNNTTGSKTAPKHLKAQRAILWLQSPFLTHMMMVCMANKLIFCFIWPQHTVALWCRWRAASSVRLLSRRSGSEGWQTMEQRLPQSPRWYIHWSDMSSRTQTTTTSSYWWVLCCGCRLEEYSGTVRTTLYASTSQQNKGKRHLVALFGVAIQYHIYETLTVTTRLQL